MWTALIRENLGDVVSAAVRSVFAEDQGGGHAARASVQNVFAVAVGLHPSGNCGFCEAGIAVRCYGLSGGWVFELAACPVDDLKCGFVAELIARQKCYVFTDPAPAQPGFAGAIFEGLGVACAGDMAESSGFGHVAAVQECRFAQGDMISQGPFAGFATGVIGGREDGCGKEFLIWLCGNNLHLLV